MSIVNEDTRIYIKVICGLHITEQLKHTLGTMLLESVALNFGQF